MCSSLLTGTLFTIYPRGIWLPFTGLAHCVTKPSEPALPCLLFLLISGDIAHWLYRTYKINF